MAQKVCGGLRFETFETWGDVLAHAANTDDVLYYHAPLDTRPRLVAVVCTFKNGKLRIDPMSPDASNFTADAGHLDRFCRRVWPSDT